MKISVVLLITILWLAFSPPRVLASWSGKVTRMENALVFAVVHAGEEKSVRLYGIYVRRPSDPAGKMAEQYTAEMLLNKEATFEVVRKGKKLHFAIVSRGETKINEELVKRGLAWVQPGIRNTPYGLKLITLQRNARRKGLGMWATNSSKLPFKAEGSVRQDKQQIGIRPKKPLLTF